MKSFWISLVAVFLVILITARAQTNKERTAESLAKKSGCFDCHGPTNKDFGPSFSDMTAKFKKDTTIRASYFDAIRNGSKGNWSSDITRGVPMPRYTGRLSDDDINKLVAWLVTL